MGHIKEIALAVKTKVRRLNQRRSDLSQTYKD